MYKKAEVKYNDEEDILYLSNGSKAVKYSIGVGDLFVADFDEKDKVIGIEILDASEVIYGVSRNILKSITSASFGARQSKGLLVLGIVIKSKIKPEPIYSSIPIQVAVKTAS